MVVGRHDDRNGRRPARPGDSLASKAVPGQGKALGFRVVGSLAHAMVGVEVALCVAARSSRTTWSALYRALRTDSSLSLIW